MADNAVESIFFDRNSGYFGRWLAEQGLPQGATDEEIVPVMEQHLKKPGSHAYPQYRYW